MSLHARPAAFGLVLIGLLALTCGGWRLLTFRPLAGGGAASGMTGQPVGRRPGFGEPAAGVLGGARPPAGPGLPAASAPALTPPLTQTTNILLAGLDTRPDWNGGHTDSLTVVVLDDESPHVGLVSIPRDLEVQVEGHEPERINAIYAIGARRAPPGAEGPRWSGGAAAGDALLRKVIHEVIGLPIAHSVYVDHASFEALVDELDGISVQVRCPIRDRFIDPRGPDGRLELHLEAGVQHLDGRTALMYARSRHGRGVFDRAGRQQAVLLGVRDRFLELGLTRSLQTLPALARTVHTDLRTIDMIRLARRLLAIKREHLHGLVLTPRHAEITIRENGRWVLVPKPEEIRAALANLFSAPLPGHRSTETCPDVDVALKRR